jgi:DNA-binding CsgD family transcriptional regulator
VLCPDLVGRDAEVDRLARRLDGLSRGEGGVLALVGDAGAGKSRLLEVVRGGAEARGIAVLAGRAVPSASPSAFRPLREALLAAFRSRPLPDHPSLAGFEGHLGQLVPSAGAPAVEESPVLLGEAVVRLLAVLAGDAGCVLLLEDLHWADPETVAVLDYLADALRGGPVLCVVTSRPTGAADEVLARLARRAPDAVVRIGPLGADDVVRMVGACLATPDPPPAVSDFVAAHCDGSPFLVEELLAGLVAAGELRHVDRRWDAPGPLTPAVPDSLRASIAQRLAALGPVERRVLGAAALLGRAFDWELLPGIAEVDGRAAADALRAAVAEQLVEAQGEGFAFRHALTREAVLAGLLPPERRELASRAWPAVELANPGLPGPVLGLAADLAEAAGDRPAAAERLVAAARRALDDGALATAEATARRARLLVDGGAVAVDADEVLVQVLAAAGKPADALALGHDLVARLSAGGAGAERQADLLVAMARAAVAAGSLDEAAAVVASARAVAAGAADAALDARIDAVAGEVALDRAELDEAARVSRRAVDGARGTDQPAVLCEALLVLGRVLRPVDAPAGRAAFAEAVEVASAAGLARWHLRAQQEVALEGWMSEGAPPMLACRDLAARYGAHVTVAVMDLSLADLALSGFDRAAALAHATACAEASRRYGLATEAVAELWLAGAHALAGDDAAMQRAIDAALAKDPDDPRILADLYGRVLFTRAVVRDELDSLRALLDEMMPFVHAAPPTTSVYPGRIFWTLLRTADDDDLGAPARAELADVAEHLGLAMFASSVDLVEAVAEGRSGRAEVAAARIAAADAAMAGSAITMGVRHVALVLVARVAMRDGWGEPVAWLREAEAFFTDGGYDRIARRCRAMLAEAGAPVPRRRGTTEVPASLRALGVTGREVDVLRLVVERRSNKDIAAELVLSPKTVERHLSSLFGRLGVSDRHALAEVGAGHLGP